MAKIDLSKMTLEELRFHLKDVQSAIYDFDRRNRAEAMAAIEEVAQKYGFRASDLIGGKAPKAPKTKTPVAPKYRHPENPSVTWSGRGRQPAWIKGKKLEDLLI